MKSTRRSDEVPRSPSARLHSASDPYHHDDAVVQAEVRRLVNALRPFGVLNRDALKRAACRTSWHEGGFDTALHAAIAARKIEPLPFGFYRLASSELGPHGEAEPPAGVA